MIKSAHVDHLRNALHKSWLSRSKAVTIAVSAANWNQCLVDNAPLYTWPIHSTFSDLIVLIKVLTIKLNNKGDCPLVKLLFVL